MLSAANIPQNKQTILQYVWVWFKLMRDSHVMITLCHMKRFCSGTRTLQSLEDQETKWSVVVPTQSCDHSNKHPKSQK